MKKVLRLIRKILLKFSFTRIATFGHKVDIPERDILVGYLVYMLIGFGCLMLPWATSVSTGWLDNLFTAVSAVSTTGLATVDIPGTYTLFGQFIIIVLIQVGGVGYMTMSSYIIYRLTHHSDDYRDRIVGTSMVVPYGMKLRDLVNNIIHFTLIFEAIGFVSFFITLSGSGIELPGWNSLFLSVSSFCTAGFSPFSDSLCRFSDNLAVNITVAVLSYAGAMGFIFITDLTYKFRKHHYKMTFTSKVILITTGILTVGGTLILYLSPTVAAGQNWLHRILLSFFQTMSAMTTVGYNTMDLSMLRVGPILVFSLIMFIGASPSGTGGGVKCTSVSAVWGFIVSKLEQRKNVTFIGRVIPHYRVDTALTSIIIYGVIIFIGVVVLSYSEPFRLSQILFEATSAIGTVGLSTGITGDLSAVGKSVIILMMYIGRVGVISFGSAFIARTRKKTSRPLPKSDLAA